MPESQTSPRTGSPGSSSRNTVSSLVWSRALVAGPEGLTGRYTAHDQSTGPGHY